MRVSDFISDIGDILCEDFTVAPVWTEAELLGYLREVIRKFSEVTLIIDQDSLRYVEQATGEANLPDNFISAYYASYSKVQIDLVEYGDLDFVSGTWLVGTTGATPYAGTVYSTGENAVIRVVPIPNNPIGPYGLGVTTAVTVADTGGTYWQVGVNTDGALTSTSSATGTTQSITIPGTSAFWTLGVNLFGVLTTAVSAAATLGDKVVLTDTHDVGWELRATTLGALTTNMCSIGKVIKVEVDGVSQDFSSNFGTIVDAYAQAVSTTPSCVARLSAPYGIVTFARCSDDAVHVWYKCVMDDTPQLAGELHVLDCYIPIIQHGVLALAYSKEGPGRDTKKSKLLDTIFKLECESVRRTFQRK